MASADALVLAASQGPTANVIARRARSIAAFAFALMSFTVFHSLAFVLAMKLGRVGTLDLLPVPAASVSS